VTTTLVAPSQDAESGTDLDTAAGTELELATLEVVDAEIVDDQEEEREDAALLPLPVVTLPPSMQMRSIPPQALMDNPRNSPDRLRDLTDLTSSLPIVGVLEPLVVVALDPQVPITDEDSKVVGSYEFMILMGHRRKYSAIEVGMQQVPCWIVEDHGAVFQILALLLENSHRASLTASQEAESFHQLTLEGWSPQQIGRIRAIPATQVRKALQIRALPSAAKQAVDAGAITIEQGRELAEFEDNPRVYDKLTGEIGNKWRFQQALTNARASRVYGEAKDLAKAKLVIDGVKVTSRPKQFGYNSREVDVRQLVDADGNRLDPQQVQTMPGMAAFIERNGTRADTTVYCVDPDKYGYRRPEARFGWMSPEQAAAKEAEEKAKAETSEQLRAAAVVRRDFIRATWGTAKAARGLFQAALRADLLGHDSDYEDDFDELYTALGGADREALLAAGDDKLRRSLVARWLCALESNLEAAVATPWSFDERQGLAFYELLMGADDPYPLTEAEVAHYELITAKLTPAVDPGDSPDEDVDEDDGEDVEIRAVSGPADEVVDSEAVLDKQLDLSEPDLDESGPEQPSSDAPDDAAGEDDGRLSDSDDGEDAVTAQAV
jgi:ParB-like chromosome segregation protein Spo0J